MLYDSLTTNFLNRYLPTVKIIFKMAHFKVKYHLKEDDLVCGPCRLIPLASASFQCKNGHLICPSCSPTTPICPKCEMPNSGIRVHVLVDKIFDQFPLACRYREGGCQVPNMRRIELLKHMENCEFRSVDPSNKNAPADYEGPPNSTEKTSENASNADLNDALAGGGNECTEELEKIVSGKYVFPPTAKCVKTMKISPQKTNITGDKSVIAIGDIDSNADSCINANEAINTSNEASPADHESPSNSAEKTGRNESNSYPDCSTAGLSEKCSSGKDMFPPPAKRLKTMETSPQKRDIVVDEIVIKEGRNESTTSPVGNVESLWARAAKAVLEPENSNVKKEQETLSNKKSFNRNTKKGRKAKRGRRKGICPFCEGIYYDKVNVCRHISSAHHDFSGGNANRNEWCCPFCKSEMLGKEDLRVHVMMNKCGKVCISEI